ncbi:glypican-2 [Canis lupus baileyi]|uniref:Glypican 2 n=2 Tax=Canis lupus familiaris TaxID=9615 RepID=A0A8I3RS61_CANLF|nr:glypican-2 [Canis lupus familiaris]XP_038394756.1 glypican-2 [Canis lupus familiaris]XP_038524021.1 glypican-2 [Canis lupus familiaris]XP_038524022.1 glypican-2 [Canis lupus familiaris]|eukprot:XP_013969701.1 glypican-2 [Canis lupus familiaris]
MSALRSLLLLLLSLCPGPGPGLGSEAKVTRSCIETRQVLGARGYSLSLLPPALISGEHLRICPQEYTCCSSEIEQRLTWDTEATFRGLVEENGSFLVHTLASRHRKFDEIFREMLLSSEHSLALLFHRSFGHLYSQHAPVFSGLFSRLRDYYERSGEGLDDALVDFWAQLLERLFPLLHPQYIFSPDYLFCLTRLASSADDSLKPFGDIPRRLYLQITRALVAARAFIQGLETGRDVVSEALKVPMSEGCKRAVMRLTGCPLCRGVPSLPPCRGFCFNVANGCLRNQGLDPDWEAYLDALLLLAEKLQGSFSFELAARSIGLKISEALMYLQDNSVAVSAQVFQQCGNPERILARTRRAPPPQEEVGRFWTPPAAAGAAAAAAPAGAGAGAGAEEERPTTTASTSMNRLVWELRERLGRARGFWAGLPTTVCGDPRMAADISQEAAPCWTGAGRGRYLSPVVGISPTEQLDNPEMEKEDSGSDLQTRRRRLQLRAATTRMKVAALGRDLELEDWDEDASGSGEGQHYADDWMAGAAAVAPPARLPRPPRRDVSGGRGGGVLVRHNQGRSRTGGTSVGFHTQPILILFLSALALLGPR